MGRVAKWFLILALLLALGDFAFLLLTQNKTRYQTMQQLPDGSWLRLDGVQLSTNSFSFYAKAADGWRGKLMRFLPRTWTGRWGWTSLGGSLTTSAWGMVQGTNVGMFTVYESVSNNSTGFTYTRLEVFDDMGNTFIGGNAMGTLGSSDGKHELRVDAWVPQAFPRRGKTLGLRYFDRKGDGWQPVAEFVVPNPMPGKYPIWTAETMPSVKNDGDLSVMLESLKSGLSKVDNTRAAGSNEIAITEAVLRSTQQGKATNAWRPVAVEIQDATGNHWKPYPHVVSVERDGDKDHFSFNGALWPGEAAWKMKFEFSRVADFSPEETCTFNGILVPGATQVIDLGNTANIGNTRLTLKAISGTKAEQPGNLKWSTVKDRVNISVALDPVTPGQRLTLLKVTDENGDDVRFSRDDDWGSPERICVLRVPEGAKQLSLTFALHKSRYVEFLAKPVAVGK